MDAKGLVQRAQQLACVDLTAQELELFSKQIKTLLSHFQEIAAVETNGLEPVVHPTLEDHVLRADEKKPGVGAEALVELAADSQGHLYKVPPVV